MLEYHTINDPDNGIVDTLPIDRDLAISQIMEMDNDLSNHITDADPNEKIYNELPTSKYTTYHKSIDPYYVTGVWDTDLQKYVAMSLIANEEEFGIVFIDSVYVSPSHRNLGIYKKLLRIWKDMAKLNKCKYLALYVSEHNRVSRTKSVREIYKNSGWLPIRYYYGCPYTRIPKADPSVTLSDHHNVNRLSLPYIEHRKAQLDRIFKALPKPFKSYMEYVDKTTSKPKRVMDISRNGGMVGVIQLTRSSKVKGYTYLSYLATNDKLIPSILPNIFIKYPETKILKTEIYAVDTATKSILEDIGFSLDLTVMYLPV